MLRTERSGSETLLEALAWSVLGGSATYLASARHPNVRDAALAGIGGCLPLFGVQAKRALQDLEHR